MIAYTKHNVLAVAMTAVTVVTMTTMGGVDAQLGAPPPQNVVDFANKQFDDYFTDCDSFVESFRNGFLWCDSEPCFRNRAKLLQVCKNTEGAQNKVHGDLVLKPSSFPSPGNWEQFTIEGQQTVCLGLQGPGSEIPLCFQFTITEKVEADDTAEFGIKSKAWLGFYNLNIGTCAGFDAVSCSPP